MTLLTTVSRAAGRCCPCLDGSRDEKAAIVGYERFADGSSDYEEKTIEMDEFPVCPGTGNDDVKRHADPSNKITEWQAGWNVTNAIQVIFYS